MTCRPSAISTLAVEQLARRRHVLIAFGPAPLPWIRRTPSKLCGMLCAGADGGAGDSAALWTGPEDVRGRPGAAPQCASIAQHARSLHSPHHPAGSAHRGDHIDVALLSMCAGTQRELSPLTRTPQSKLISSPHYFCMIAGCRDCAASTVLAAPRAVAIWTWLQGSCFAAGRRHSLMSQPNSAGGHLLGRVPPASWERRLRGGLHHGLSEGRRERRVRGRKVPGCARGVIAGRRLATCLPVPGSAEGYSTH